MKNRAKTGLRTRGETVLLFTHSLTPGNSQIPVEVAMCVEDTAGERWKSRLTLDQQLSREDHGPSANVQPKREQN